MKNYLLPDFLVRIDESCIGCGRCARECSFRVLEMNGKRPKATPTRCVACRRCVVFCPTGAISVLANDVAYRQNPYWPSWLRKDLVRQAQTGGMLLAGAGNDLAYPAIWDHLLLDASQVTNPSIDPLREPMEVVTFLGSKPASLEVAWDDRGGLALKTVMPPQIRLDMPILLGAMSLGAVNLNVHRILARAAQASGTLWNCGEGGLHEDLYPYGANTIVQVASGRFGVHPRYLEAAAAVEIKMGQGAKPGIGGHLPGEKVTSEIASTRMIPEGADALSPAPHHDIYSIEDLAQLVGALKQATGNSKPIGVKIAAVHHVAAIASGAVRAGADFLTIDGFRGGTGAAPKVVRNHMGIPIELALAAVDDRLRQEGIRNQVTLIASGGIRCSADMMKAIALGADAVAIGTAALISLGCTLCQACHTGRCAWGLTTQDASLAARQNVEEGTQRLMNLLQAWNAELKEMLGALGINAVESLRGNRERLRAVGLDSETLAILGVQAAGRE
ncbi:MAG: glutamate synthase-related protein [Anaerolineae bacterium]